MGCLSTKDGLTESATHLDAITESSASPGGANQAERRHQPLRDVTNSSRVTAHLTRIIREDSSMTTRDADQARQDTQFTWHQYYQLVVAYNKQVDTTIRLLESDKETLRKSYEEDLSRLREESKQLQEAVSQLTDERDLLASNLSIAATSRETNEMNIEIYKKKVHELQKRYDNDCWEQQQHQQQQQQQEPQQVAPDNDDAVTKTTIKKKTPRKNRKQQLRDLQQSYEEELSRLREESKQLQEVVSQLTDERDAWASNLSLTATSCDANEMNIEMYKKKLLELQKRYDNDCWKQQQQQQQPQQVAPDNDDGITKTTIKKKTSRKIRKQQLRELQQRHDEEIVKLQQEYSDVALERDKALADLSCFTSMQDRALADLSGLTSERDQDLAKLSGLTSERDQAVANLLSLTSERDQALADLSHTATCHAVDTENITRHGERLQRLQTSQDEINALFSELQKVKQEKSQAVASLAELEAHRTDEAKQTPIYQRQLKELQQRYDEDVSALHGELEKVTEEKEQAVSDLARHMRSHGVDVEQIEAYKQQLHDLQQSHADEISMLRSKLQKLTQEKNQAVASLGELKEHHIDDAKQITSYQRQLQDLQERYDGEIGRLQQKYQEANNDLSRVTNEKEKAIADLASLNERLSADAKQMEIYKKQLRDLQQRMDSEVGRLQQENQNVNRDLSLVTQKKKKLMADLASLEVRFRADAKQMEIYKQQLQDLQQRHAEEIMRWQQEYSDFASAGDQALADLSGVASERDQTLANLSGVITERDQKLADLSGVITKRDQKLADLLDRERETHHVKPQKTQPQATSSSYLINNLQNIETRLLQSEDKQNKKSNRKSYQSSNPTDMKPNHSNNTNDDANQK